MKSDHMWDLGTVGGQQRLLVPTAGATAAYAEQAHNAALNDSSDIFRAEQQPPNMSHDPELNDFLAADPDQAEG